MIDINTIKGYTISCCHIPYTLEYVATLPRNQQIFYTREQTQLLRHDENGDEGHL